MKRSYPAIIAILLFLPACLAGCSSKSPGQDKIIASVGNKLITLSDFKQKLSRMPAYYQGLAQKNKKILLDDMIVESLFLEDAVRKGIDRDKEVKDILEEAKKKVIIAKFVKTEVEDKIRVSDGEMKKYYEEHKDEFKKPEMWRASHILVATEDEARAVQSALAGGKSFQDLAREKSIDATAARLGDVGYFRKGQVMPEFENACFSLKVGETSGIVRTQFGYHIIKLTDKRPESVQSFEEAKTTIEDDIKTLKRGEMLSKLVTDLKNKYRVRIEDDAMKAIDAVNSKK
jgi:peptidyl-prolyl cis-trans isomerase C